MLGSVDGPSPGVAPAPAAHPGERLGLPEAGPGAVAGFGARVGGFLVDAVFSALVAALLVQGVPGNYSLAVFAVEVIVLTATTGQTLGMYLAGTRVVRLDGRALGVWALVRTALLILLIPAVIYDSDHRGLHDRAAAAVVVRSR